MTALTTMIKILSTRSLPETLIREAASEKIEVHVQEFISVQPNIREEDIPVIRSLLPMDNAVVIFTGKHAVQILADLTDQEKIFPKWNICCISEVTLQTAKQRFPGAVVEGAGSYAADLADLILKKHLPEAWFFCGNLRRDTLPDKLRGNGIRVNEIILYETRLTPHLVTANYNGIVFFSPSAVESFFSANNTGKNEVYFAIGKTTAAAVKNKSGRKAVIAEKQDARVMIRTVIDHYQQNNYRHG